MKDICMCYCHVGGPINHPPPMPDPKLTEEGKRILMWFFDGGGHLRNPVCIYFQNPARGLDCTAQNCPCGDYEVEE